jgi:hypothetical protein
MAAFRTPSLSWKLYAEKDAFFSALFAVLTSVDVLSAEGMKHRALPLARAALSNPAFNFVGGSARLFNRGFADFLQCLVTEDEDKRQALLLLLDVPPAAASAEAPDSASLPHSLDEPPSPRFSIEGLGEGGGGGDGSGSGEGGGGGSGGGGGGGDGGGGGSGGGYGDGEGQSEGRKGGSAPASA